MDPDDTTAGVGSDGRIDAGDLAPEDLAVESGEDLRRSLAAVLGAAEAGGVPRDEMAGLLTAYLARLRGDVRLPLGMAPDRAREFRERAADHLRETMQIELVVTPEVIDEIDLQLSAVEGDGPGE